MLLRSSLLSRTGVFACLVGFGNVEIMGPAEALEEEEVEEVTVIRVCELVSCCCWCRVVVIVMLRVVGVVVVGRVCCGGMTV